jgi:hypothetical protein
MALAEELGMRPLIAHCHLGLGKLYQSAGKREWGAGALQHRDGPASVNPERSPS